MSKKYDDFKAELTELCVKHKVQLSTSDYDIIVVTDSVDNDKYGQAGIYDDRIVDSTDI